MTPASPSLYLSNIPVLNRSNYLNWYEQLLIVLGYLDLDLALHKLQSDSLAPLSSSDQKKLYEK